MLLSQRQAIGIKNSLLLLISVLNAEISLVMCTAVGVRGVH